MNGESRRAPGRELQVQQEWPEGVADVTSANPCLVILSLGHMRKLHLLHSHLPFGKVTWLDLPSQSLAVGSDVCTAI